MNLSERIDAAILSAAQGYLRTSRSGGMPRKQSEMVEAVVADMARLSMFSVAVAETLAEMKLKVTP